MHPLLGSLPFLTVIFWTAALYIGSSSGKCTLRWSLALALLGFGTFTLILTESLSAIHLLRPIPILLAWTTVSVAPLIVLWSRREAIDLTSEISRLRKKVSLLPLWLAVIITLTFFLIVIMAAFTPPMNFDVQIYHLPRQVFWMMQKSIEPFAATHTHQISMPVLSEYLGLQLLLLSGGDAWHNLLQALFMAASCGLVSTMVSDLGGSVRAQGLAVLSMLLLPVAFFEASNSKNDILLSLLVLIPLSEGLRIWTAKSPPSPRLLCLIALSAGLALAAKGTAIVYLAPSAVLVLIACMRQGALRPLLLAVVPGLLLILLPPLPQILRNERLFHSPAGPNLHHGNLSHQPSDLVNVTIRNIAGQFTCNLESWNKALETSTRDVLQSLGLDPDDPSTTFEGQKFHLPYFAGLEDIVPAPVQTILLILLPASLLIPSLRKQTGFIPFFLCAFGALLLFCFLFRWQPWQARLLIPGYFMAAPMIGLLLDLLRPTWIPVLVTTAELLTLAPHIKYAGQRPLLGASSILRMSREDQMSRMMPGRAEELRILSAELSKAPPAVIQIDGGATEIYGLLRKLSSSLPDTSLISGPAEEPAPIRPCIIQSTTHDAGVQPPPRNPAPKTPPGYRIFWIGDYYRVFNSSSLSP